MCQAISVFGSANGRIHHGQPERMKRLTTVVGHVHPPLSVKHGWLPRPLAPWSCSFELFTRVNPNPQALNKLFTLLSLEACIGSAATRSLCLIPVRSFSMGQRRVPLQQAPAAKARGSRPAYAPARMHMHKIQPDKMGAGHCRIWLGLVTAL